jgi:fluoroacetyl-CoA thioesterase
MRSVAMDTNADIRHVITAVDLATNWENDVPVLATPVLLWLAEKACMAVVDAALEPGELTVGCRHDDAAHLAATPVGWQVTMSARLIGQDGTLLHFAVTAEDGEETVYRGRHTRAVIQRARFEDRLARKVAGTAPAMAS